MLFEVKERHQYSRKKGFIKKIVNLLNEEYEKHFIEDLCNYLVIQSLDIDEEKENTYKRNGQVVTTSLQIYTGNII